MGVRPVAWVSFGTALLVSLIWFLSISILANQATGKAATTINLNLLTLIGSKQRPLRHGSTSNLHSVSKRRVPNGPDPIHNRRARNFREPPTRA